MTTLENATILLLGLILLGSGLWALAHFFSPRLTEEEVLAVLGGGFSKTAVQIVDSVYALRGTSELQQLVGNYFGVHEFLNDLVKRNVLTCTKEGHYQRT